MASAAVCCWVNPLGGSSHLSLPAEETTVEKALEQLALQSGAATVELFAGSIALHQLDPVNSSKQTISYYAPLAQSRWLLKSIQHVDLVTPQRATALEVDPFDPKLMGRLFLCGLCSSTFFHLETPAGKPLVSHAELSRYIRMYAGHRVSLKMVKNEGSLVYRVGIPEKLLELCRGVHSFSYTAPPAPEELLEVLSIPDGYQFSTMKPLTVASVLRQVAYRLGIANEDSAHLLTSLPPEQLLLTDQEIHIAPKEGVVPCVLCTRLGYNRQLLLLPPTVPLAAHSVVHRNFRLAPACPGADWDQLEASMLSAGMLPTVPFQEIANNTCCRCSSTALDGLLVDSRKAHGASIYQDPHWQDDHLRNLSS